MIFKPLIEIISTFLLQTSEQLNYCGRAVDKYFSPESEMNSAVSAAHMLYNHSLTILH